MIGDHDRVSSSKVVSYTTPDMIDEFMQQLDQLLQDVHERRLALFEHIELPAKQLDYFLRSNKSNINQSERDSARRNPRQ